MIEKQSDGLRRYWYIGCPSSRLQDKPLAIRLFDLDLVLFRGASRVPHALLDRCCHRGVQLSLGRVEEGQLACRYHGWRYDGSGRCVLIPSMVAGRLVPDEMRVQSFPCVEQDGYVWIWSGGTVGPSSRPVAIPEFADHLWRQGTVTINAASEHVLENNLDWCHPAFAHPWTHGQFFVHRFGGAREQIYEVRFTQNGLTVFAPPTVNATAPMPDRPIVKLAFTLPDRIRAEFWRPFHLLIYMHAVPMGTNCCRLEWVMPRLLPIGRKVVWARRVPLILTQDRIVLESAERAYRGEDQKFEQSVPADASTLLLRLLLRHAARGTWESVMPKLSRRRLIKVRA